MKPLTAEWIGKAEGDFAVVRRELRARVKPNYAAACFHAQQCVEKYMKSCLQEADVAFPYTHNLIVLYNLLLPIDTAWKKLQTDLLLLNNYAISSRYPGFNAIRSDALVALRLRRKIRRAARYRLNLPLF